MKHHPDKLDPRRRLLFSRGVLAVATLWQLRRAAAHDAHHHHAGAGEEILENAGVVAAEEPTCGAHAVQGGAEHDGAAI